MPEETLKAIAELKDLRVLYLGFSVISIDGLRTLGSLDKVEKLGLQGAAGLTMPLSLSWQSGRA